MCSCLSQSISNSNILETLGKFIFTTARGSFPDSSFVGNWTNYRCSEENKWNKATWNDYYTWYLPEKIKQKAAYNWDLLPNTRRNPRVSCHRKYCKYISFPYQIGNSITCNTSSLPNYTCKPWLHSENLFLT